MAIIIGRVQNLTGGRFFVKDKDGNIKELNLNDSIYENDTVYGDSANSISSKIDILLSDTGVVVLNKGQKQLIDESLIKTAFGTEELFFTRESLEQTIDEHNLILDVDSDLRETKFKDDASIAEEDTKEGQEEKEDEEEGSGAFANRDGNIIDIESNLRKKAWAITRTFNEVEKSRELENIIKKELGKVPSNPFQPYQPTNQNSLNTVRPSTVKIEKSNRPESEGARPDDINQTNKDKLSTTPPSTLFVENPTNLSINDVTIYEQDGKLYFTVTLDKALKNDVIFTYKTNSGTATEGIDFIGKTGIITIPSGQTEVQISIDIIDDFIYENSEYFNIEITDIEGNIIPLKTQAIATILDNPPAFNEILGDSTDSQTGSYGAEDTVFAIITGDNSVKEGYTSSYKVELIDKDGNPVNVKQDTEVTVVYKNISTQDNDTEYKNEDKLKFIIKAGFSNVTFTVETIDDFYADNGEEFKLELEFVNTNEFENISLGDINQKNKYVTTEILDNTTTNPNNPSTVEATQENVILKLVACDDSGNPIMDGDKYTFTNSVAEGSSSKYMVLAFAPNTTSFTTSTVLDTQYQGGTVTISTTDGSAVTTGNIDNATLDFEKQSSTSVTVGQFFEIYSIDDYLADNNETFTVNIDTSSYTHPSTPIYENITIDSEKITTTIFDNSTDSPTQDSNIEPTQDSVIIKIVVANPDGTPKKDTNGNYLTQSDVTEGDSAYYVILAFKPDSNGVFNDSTKLADDKLFGSVEITTENIDAIGVSTQTFENGTQDYISFSNRVDLNTLITVKTLDDWKADNDEQFEIKIIDKSYDHPSSDIKYENITTDLNPVVTTIKDNTTTTPNIPSEIENSNNDNSAVEPVVLKIIALNQAGKIILKKDGAEDKFIANFDDLYNYDENNIATLKEEYAGYSFADKNSVTEGSNSSYMVLAFAPNTTNFTTNTVLDTQYQGGTVTISTTDGTAKSNGTRFEATLDYEAKVIEATDGKTVTVGQAFQIKTLDDELADSEETFTVNIDNSSYIHPSTAIYENVTIKTESVTTTIYDNSTTMDGTSTNPNYPDTHNTEKDSSGNNDKEIVVLKLFARNVASDGTVTYTNKNHADELPGNCFPKYIVLAFKETEYNEIYKNKSFLTDDDLTAITSSLKQVGEVNIIFGQEGDNATGGNYKDSSGDTLPYPTYMPNSDNTGGGINPDYDATPQTVKVGEIFQTTVFKDYAVDLEEFYTVKIKDVSYKKDENNDSYESVVIKSDSVQTDIKERVFAKIEVIEGSVFEGNPLKYKITFVDEYGKTIALKESPTLTLEYKGLNTDNKNPATVKDHPIDENNKADFEPLGIYDEVKGDYKLTITDYEALNTQGYYILDIETIRDIHVEGSEWLEIELKNISYHGNDYSIKPHKNENFAGLEDLTKVQGEIKDNLSGNTNEYNTVYAIITGTQTIIEGETSTDYKVELLYKDGSPVNVTADTVVTIELKHGDTDDNDLNKIVFTDGSSTAISTNSGTQSFNITIKPNTSSTTFTIETKQDFWADNNEKFDLTIIAIDGSSSGQATEKFEKVVFDDSYTGLSEVDTPSNTVTTTIIDDSKPTDGIYPDPNIPSDGKVETDDAQQVILRIVAVDKDGNLIMDGDKYTFVNDVTEGSNSKYMVLAFAPNTTEFKVEDKVNVQGGTVKIYTTDGIAKTTGNIDNAELDFEKETGTREVTVGTVFDIKTLDDYLADNNETFTVNIVNNSYLHPTTPIYENVLTNSGNVETTIKDNTTTTPNIPSEIENDNNGNSAVESVVLKIVALDESGKIIITKDSNTKYVSLEELKNYSDYSFVTNNDVKEGNNAKYMVLAFNPNTPDGDLTVKNALSQEFQGGTVTIKTAEATDADKKATILDEQIAGDGNKDYQTYSDKLATLGVAFEVETFDDWRADDGEKFNVEINSGTYTHPSSGAIYENVTTDENKATTTILDNTTETPNENSLIEPNQENVILKLVALNESGNILLTKDGAKISINKSELSSYKEHSFIFENEAREGATSKYMVFAFLPTAGSDFTVKNLTSVQGGTVTVNTIDNSGDAKQKTDSTDAKIDGTEDYIAKTQTGVVVGDTVFEVTILDDYLKDGGENFQVEIANGTYAHPEVDGVKKPIYENVVTNSGKVETTIKDNPASITGTTVDGENKVDDGTTYGKEDTVYVKIINDAVVVEGGKLEHYIQLVDKDGNAVVIPDGEEIIVTLKYTIDNGDIKNADFKEANHQYNESTKELIVTLNSATEIDANGVYKLPIINETVIDENVEITEKYTLTITNVKQSVGKFENIAIGDVNGTNKSVTGTIHDNPVKIVLVAVTASDINENGTVKLENIDLSKTTNTAPEGGKLYYVAVAVDSVSNKPLLTQTGSVKVAYTTEDIVGNKATLENATNSDPKYPTDIKIYEETKETVSLGKVFIVDALDDYYTDANEEFKVIISEPDATAQTTYKTFDVNNSSVDVTLGNTTVISTITDNAPTTGAAVVTGNPIDGSSYGEEDTLFVVITADTKTVKEGDELVYYLQILDKDGNKVEIPSDEKITVNLEYESNTGVVDASDFETGIWTQKVDIESTTTYVEDKGYKFTNKTIVDNKVEKVENYTVTIGTISQEKNSFENIVSGYSDTYKTTHSDTLNGKDGKSATGAIHDNPVKIVLVAVTKDDINEDGTVKLENINLSKTTNTAPEGGKLYYVAVAIDTGNNKPLLEQVGNVKVAYTTNGIAEGSKVTLTGATDTDPKYPTDIKIYEATKVDLGKVFIVDALDDYYADANESFEVIISNPDATAQTTYKTFDVNNSSVDVTLGNTTVTSTITDNKPEINKPDTKPGEDNSTINYGTEDTVYAVITGATTVNEGGTTTYEVKLVDKAGNIVIPTKETKVTVTYTNMGTTSDADTNKNNNDTINVTLNSSSGLGTFTIVTTDDYYAEESNESYKVQITGVTNTGEFENVKFNNYDETGITNLSNNVVTTIVDNPATKNETVTTDSNPIDGIDDDNKTIYGEEDTVWAVISADTNSVTEGGKVTYTVKLVESNGEKAVTVTKPTTVKIKFTGVDNPADLDDILKVFNGDANSTEENSNGFEIINNGTEDEYILTITIPANSDKTQFTILTKPDVYTENPESFDLTIHDIDSTEFENLVFDRLNGQAEGSNKTTTTIQDRDPADKDEDNTVYAIISGNAEVYEGGETEYTVTLVDRNGNEVDVEAGKPVSVTIVYTDDGTDFTKDIKEILDSEDNNLTPDESGAFTLTISSGSSTTFTVKTRDDYYAEGDENYKVQITNVDDTQNQFEKVEWENYENTLIPNSSNSVTSTIKDNESQHKQNISVTGEDSNRNTYGEEDTIWAVIEAVDGSGNVIENPKPTEGESITYRVWFRDKDGNQIGLKNNTKVDIKFEGIEANPADLNDILKVLNSSGDEVTGFDANSKILTIDIPKKDETTNSETTFTITTKVDVLNEMKAEKGEEFKLDIDKIYYEDDSLANEFENLVYGTVTTEIKDTIEPTKENTVYAIITGDDTVKEGSSATYKVQLLDYEGNEVKVTQNTDVTIKYNNITTQDDDTQYNHEALITVTITAGNSSQIFNVQSIQDFWADNNEKFDLTITGVGSCFACGAQSEEFEKVIFSDYSAGGYEGKDVDGLKPTDLTNTVTTTIIDNSNDTNTDTISPHYPYPDPNLPGTEENGDTQAVILKIVVANQDGTLKTDANGNYLTINDVKEGDSAYYKVIAFRPDSNGVFNNLTKLADDKQVGSVEVTTADKTSGLIAKGVDSQNLDNGDEDYISFADRVELNTIITVKTLDDWRADNDEQYEIKIVDKTYNHPKVGEDVTPVYENVVTDNNPVTTTIKDDTDSTPNNPNDDKVETTQEQVILKIVIADESGKILLTNGTDTEYKILEDIKGLDNTWEFVFDKDVNEGDKAYYKVLAFHPNTDTPVFKATDILDIQAGTVTISTKESTTDKIATGVEKDANDEYLINGNADYVKNSQEIELGSGLFTVTILDDYKAEADEKFEVTILGEGGNGTYKHPSSGAVYENVKSERNVTTTIKDNEAQYNQTVDSSLTIDNPASGSGNYGQEDTVWAVITSDKDSVVEGKSVTYTVKLVESDGITPVTVSEATTVTIKFAGTNAILSDLQGNGGFDANSELNVQIPSNQSQVQFTITTLDDFEAEGNGTNEEKFTLTIDSVEEHNEFENLVWNDDTKNNSVTTTIKDGVTLGTPENATVYEHSLYKDIEDKPKTDSQSLDITNPNNDDYDVFFDTEFDNFTYTHDETKYPFKSNGSELNYEYSDGGKILIATRKSDNKKVFTITLNDDKQTYKFELHQPMDHIIEHDNDTSFDIPFKFYVESDDTKSDSKEVKVTVMDSVPVATDIVETIYEDGVSTTIRLSNEAFQGGEIIIDGNTIANGEIANIYDNNQEIESQTNPIGTLTNNGDGTVTFTPKANYSNYDQTKSPKFEYTVTDFDGDTVTKTVTINVNPVADKPTMEANETIETFEDDKNIKEGTNATKLNLKLPVITDATDQNNGVGDSPERLGAIEFKFNTSSDFGTAKIGYMESGVFKNFGASDLKITQSSTIKFIINKEGYHTQEAQVEEGVILITKEQYENMAIIHKEDNATNIKTTISVKSYEVKEDGSVVIIDGNEVVSAPVSQTITLDVKAVTDKIELKWTDGNIVQDSDNTKIIFETINEGTTATIDLKSYLSKTSGAGSDATLDLDGSEKRTYTIEGVPHGTIVNLDGKIATAGTDGKITIPFPDNTNEDPEFSIIFPDTYSGTVKGKITLSVYDTDSDSTVELDTKTESVFFTISINPVANPVTINVAQAVGDEDQARDDEGNIPDLTTAQKGINLNINVYSDDNTDIEGTGTEEDDFGSTLDEKETYNVTIGDIPNGSSILVWDNALEKEVLVTFIDDSTPPTKQVWDTDSKSWVEYTDSNITTPTESGKYVLKIEDYQNDKQPKLITPFDSDVDFTLQISAQSVDGESINKSSNLPLKITLNATVDIVAGEFNFETVNGTNYQVVVNEDSTKDSPTGNTNNGAEISLSDIYNTKPSTNDTDGSESLSYVITGLGADFELLGATLLKGEENTRVWIVSEEQFNSVKITTKQHFSGEIGFKIGYISTEEAGASNTQTDVANLTDAKILVKPVAEATVNDSMDILEDELKVIDFNVIKPDSDETLESITINASSFTGKDFKMYYFNGISYIELNSTTDVSGLANISKDGSNNIKFENGTWENIFVQFNDDLGTSSNNTFNFDYVIKDITSDGSSYTDEITHLNNTYTLTLSPVTDNIFIDVAGTDNIVGNHIEVDAGTDGKEEVTINSTGSFTVTVDISALASDGNKNPDGSADSSKDTDGSETIQYLEIVGVPDGVKVDGGSFGKLADGTNIWFLKVDKPLNAETITKNIQFIVSDKLYASQQEFPITITAYNKDGVAENITQASTKIIFKDNMDYSGGASATGSVNASFALIDFHATEDAEFSLSDIITITPDSARNDEAYSIVFKAPKNAEITEESMAHLNSYVKDGETYYVLSIPNQSSIETELEKIKFLPEENMNKNNQGSEKVEIEITMTGYVPGNANITRATDTKTFVDNAVIPVTDKPTLSITKEVIDEDNTTETFDIVIKTVDTDNATESGNPTYTLVDNTVTITHVTGSVLGKFVLADNSEKVFTDGSSITLTKAQLKGIKFIPTANVSGEAKFTASATTQETRASTTETGTGNITITVIPVVDGIENFTNITASGKEDTKGKGTTLGDNKYTEIKAGENSLSSLNLIDTDGSEEVTQITLKGLPDGFTVHYGDHTMATNGGKDGTTTIDGKEVAINTWSIPAVGGKLPNIYIKAPEHWSGTVADLTLSTVVKDGTVEQTFVENFSVSIEAVASDITITPTDAIGKEYAWNKINLNANATDIDGSETTIITLKAKSGSNDLDDTARFKLSDGTILDGQDGRPSATFSDGTWTLSGIKNEDLPNLQIMYHNFNGEIDVTAKTVDGADTLDTAVTGKFVLKTSTSSIIDLSAENNDINFDIFANSETLQVIGRDGGEDNLILGDIDFSKLAGKITYIDTLDLGKAGDIAGNKDQIISLTLEDVLNMTDSDNKLIIKGDSDDKVTFAKDDGWELKNENIGQDGFDIYTNTGDSSVKVKVQTDINDQILI